MMEYKPLKDMSDEALLDEWKFWNWKIIHASSWGAGLAAANEFRRDAASELRRRGLEVPK